MSDTQFFDNFVFTEFCFNTFRHNDISMGIEHHYIGYMREGHGNIVTENQSVCIKQGEFFYLPKGLKYQSYWYVGEKGCVRFDSYAFKHMPRRDNIIYPPQAIAPFDCANLLNLKLSENKNIEFQSVGIFYQLLGALVGKMVCVPEDRKGVIVQTAEDYMRENIWVGAADIAKHCGISQTGLYEAFKAVRGYTPVTAKHKIAVERASNLLVTTDMSVEEISRQLGFGTAAYFRKIFFKVTQKTPREVRKNTVL